MNTKNYTSQKNRQPDDESILRNIKGTFAIEGIMLNESSINNLERILSGSATYEQVLSEIKEKYRKKN